METVENKTKENVSILEVEPVYVTLASLVATIKPETIVRLKFRSCNRKVKDGRRVYDKFTFENNIISITGITTYPQYVYVTGKQISGEAFAAILPPYFKVSILNEKDAEPIKTKMKKKLLDGYNFSYQVSYAGSIGADPEIFVTRKNGELIPAPMFLGSKQNPNYTSGTESGHGHNPCYWDGFQAEFTTWAGSCLGWFVDSVQYGLSGVLEHARKKIPDAKLSLDTVVMIPQDLLNTAPDEVVNFGCMPSLNAYGLSVDIPPGRQVPFRSVGGHIHFGYGAQVKQIHIDAVRIVKALDAIIGVGCVSLFGEIDSPLRRQYYGLPGEYRLPAHGIEYRPLSAAWLCHPFITNLVVDVARKAFMLGKNNLLDLAWTATEEETVECMLKSDIVKAREILTRNKETFLKLISACYGSIVPVGNDNCNNLFNVFINGMQSVLEDPFDIEANWRLTNGAHGQWIPHGENNVKNNLKHIALGKKFC